MSETSASAANGTINATAPAKNILATIPAFIGETTKYESIVRDWGYTPLKHTGWGKIRKLFVDWVKEVVTYASD